MKDTKITDSILYVGVDDKDLDLFESQYVVPNGVSYNSYVILDEKVTLMDTVDQRATKEWLENLDAVLEGRTIDYLVVSHMEPDHAANAKTLIDKFPNMKIVGNAKTFAMMSQFFDVDLTGRSVVVKEGDTLNLGAHTLQFIMAPMVHWPEVMVTYEPVSYTHLDVYKRQTFRWEPESRRVFFWWDLREQERHCLQKPWQEKRVFRSSRFPVLIL